MSLDTSKPISKITYNNVEIPLSGGNSTSNIITFECTANSNAFPISHDTLVINGIDTEDKFFKIVRISIIPKKMEM